VGDEHDARAGLHVAVVGDIVVFSLRALNPAIENTDEIREANPSRARYKELYVDLLQVHERSALPFAGAAITGRTVSGHHAAEPIVATMSRVDEKLRFLQALKRQLSFNLAGAA